ncbi:MAG: FAD-binding protein [Bacteroidota bacterium]|nr:FAD-binding protein [Bacteroidota bacterium]
MKRKTFLKISSTIAVTPLFKKFPKMHFADKLKNWAGNIEYSTDNVFYPATAEEVKKLLRSKDKMRSLGTRHCFNRIADSRHNLISSNKMNKVISLDSDANTVTVEGGIKYGELAPFLQEKGFALHNLASLPHISVAGSITTATHGSGVTNGNLASAVRSLEIIKPGGSVITLSKGASAEFEGAVVGLGALGFINTVTLAIEPTYEMRQYVFEKLPFAELNDNFEKIMSAGYSVSLFTDWQGDTINEVWIKQKTSEPASFSNQENFYGAKAATKNMHPIAELSAENCTEQMGVTGPWYERLPHFKMGFTPSSGKELQAEYFVPREHAVEAMFAVKKMSDQIGPHLFISEIRTIAADDLWMSPCRHQDSVTIHFTWKQEWDEVKKLLPQIEEALSKYNVRPHWGKLFTISPKTLQGRYPKLPEFKQLVQSMDPAGKFRNQFLNDNIYG